MKVVDLLGRNAVGIGVECEERRDWRLVKKFMRATSAVRNKCNSRSAKNAVQCVIVSDLRGNNEETDVLLKNNGVQSCHSSVRHDRLQ